MQNEKIQTESTEKKDIPIQLTPFTGTIAEREQQLQESLDAARASGSCGMTTREIFEQVVDEYREQKGLVSE